MTPLICADVARDEVPWITLVAAITIQHFVRYRRIVPRPASARRVVRFLIPIDGVLFVSLVSWWCNFEPEPTVFRWGDRKF